MSEKYESKFWRQKERRLIINVRHSRGIFRDTFRNGNAFGYESINYQSTIKMLIKPSRKGKGGDRLAF